MPPRIKHGPQYSDDLESSFRMITMNETPEYREYREAIEAAEERFRKTLRAPMGEVCIVCGAPMVEIDLGLPKSNSCRTVNCSANMRHQSVTIFPELARPE